MSLAAKILDRVPARVMVPSIAWQYRLFEPELRKLSQFVPNERGAVDVGVWWGPWTWWLARRVPRVDSFEPNPDVVARVAPVMPRNVNIHTVALSNQTGRSNLWLPPGGSSTEGRASLEPEPRAGLHWRTQSVVTSRLDDFDLGDVGFVKIDVEGHELAVLQGAENLLEAQRPVLMVEIEDHPYRQASLDDVVDFLSEHSYRGQFLQKGRWRPTSDLDRRRTRQMAARVVQRGYGVNFLFHARGFAHNFVFTPM